MPVFDPLTIGSLLILASAQSSPCVMPKPTDISAVPSTKEITWDYSKTVADIQGVKMDTVNPYAFSGATFTEGYMNGSIKMTPHVKLAYQTLPEYNAACIWYDSIDIDMQIDPTIVIPKEVHEDSCMGPAVAQHELKHIKVDREMVNKYIAVMGQKVYDGLSDRGFIAGPVPMDQLQPTIARMQDTVNQIVCQEYKRMDLDRIDAQRAVDSVQEYRRVQAMCPDYNPAKLK